MAGADSETQLVIPHSSFAEADLQDILWAINKKSADDAIDDGVSEMDALLGGAVEAEGWKKTVYLPLLEEIRVGHKSTRERKDVRDHPKGKMIKSANVASPVGDISIFCLAPLLGPQRPETILRLAWAKGDPNRLPMP